MEFDNNRKEFSVIPLTWLSDDKHFCFWPKNVKSQDHLQSMIETLTHPTASWHYYSIKKIHNTTGKIILL